MPFEPTVLYDKSRVAAPVWTPYESPSGSTSNEYTPTWSIVFRVAVTRRPPVTDTPWRPSPTNVERVTVTRSAHELSPPAELSYATWTPSPRMLRTVTPSTATAYEPFTSKPISY